MSAEVSQLLEGRRALLVTRKIDAAELNATDEIALGITTGLRQAGASVVVLEVTTTDLTEVQRLIERQVSGASGGDSWDILVCHLLAPPRPQALEQSDPQLTCDALQAIAATHAAMRATFPALRASGHGRILLVGHRYGESVNEAIGPDNAAAWGLIGLARTAAVDWGQYQITTNVLIPLAHTRELEAAAVRRPQIIDRLTRQLPLRRAGDPTHDIGAAAAVFASDLMRFVNGEVVHIDGGQHVAGPLLNPARFS